ncbi:MAG: hypothetical protein Q4E57_10385 [Eubacteriales bacterium]|nr:hypothetical protein [Eubacteriales bacterium]
MADKDLLEIIATPVPDPESFSGGIRSYAKSLERIVRNRTKEEK